MIDRDGAKAFVSQEHRRIIRVGHRGAAGHAPENTIAAIRKGIALGVDYVEVDVHRTRDGSLVVMHDASVDRTTDGTGLIAEMSWDELQALDAGDGESVPLVEESLAVSGQTGIMLEIKSSGIAPQLVDTVRSSAFAGTVVYASFLHSEIAEVRSCDASARTMALVGELTGLEAGFAQNVGASIVGLAYQAVTAESIAMLHQTGLDVWVYTVNEMKDILRVIEMGADGVISDFPERVPNTA